MSFLSPDPGCTARCLVAAAAVALGAAGPARAQDQQGQGAVGARAAPGGHGGGGQPRWAGFAATAAYMTYERSALRHLTRLDDGRESLGTTTEDATGAGLNAELGARYRTSRGETTAAGMVGLLLREEDPIDAENVTLGARLQSAVTLGPRWSVDGQGQLFEGLQQSEQAIGASASAGAGAGAGTERRALVQTRFLRAGLGLNAGWQQTARVGHQFGAALDVLTFPDQRLVRLTGQRLFEVWTAGPRYLLTWQPDARETYTLETSSQTTWFLPVVDVPREEGTLLDDSATLETLASRLGWQHELNAHWSTRLEGGAGALFPVEQPELARLVGLGAAGIYWRETTSAQGLEAYSEVAQSETGALLNILGARVSAERTLDNARRWAAMGSLSGSRFRVLRAIYTSPADRDAVAGVAGDVPLSEAERNQLALDAQQAWGADATLGLSVELWGFVGLSVVYGYQRRFPDTGDVGAQQTQRVTLTLTAMADTDGLATLGQESGEN